VNSSEPVARGQPDLKPLNWPMLFASHVSSSNIPSGNSLNRIHLGT
jgi:hypothetical protein